MKDNARISNAVIRRLPRYRRYLGELQKKGVEKISSNEFSELIGYTASQIRQDLNNFGGFGQQGYGYSVSGLYKEIGDILGLDQEYRVVIVGAGNLGRAISGHLKYHMNGFKVCGIFEADPNLIGKEIHGLKIYNYEELVPFCEKEKIDIGVICAPVEVAQEIADKLCFAGAKGIWNFAIVDLEAPVHVCVENVHVTDSLYALVYNINAKKN